MARILFAQRIKSPFLFGLVVFLSLPLFAQENPEAFLAAREAFRVGDAARLERAAAGIGERDVLAPYVDYFRVKLNLEQADPATVRAFLERNDPGYVAEKLRGDWVRVLAKRRQWSEVEAEAGKMLAPEQDLVCHALYARSVRKDAGVLDEIQPLWLTLLDPPEACVPVLEALIWGKRVLADDVWARVRRQFEANRIAWAKASLLYLPPSQTPDMKQADLLIERPMNYLAKLPAQWAATRPGREFAALAVARLAANDPNMAANRLEMLQSRLEESEKQWAWSQIGLFAARRHLPEALAWYLKADKAPLSDEGAAWKIRAALRAGHWEAVRQTIEAMPLTFSALPEWTYWLGRAHKAGGRPAEADILFKRIAGFPNFYGNLADEELGRPLLPPPAAAPPTRDELAAAQGTPGLRRAFALFNLDLRTEAVREWNWTLRAMSDRELLAAADLARRNQIYDRAINTADRTRNEHDYKLRYLTPFVEEVRTAAEKQSLDDAWVYGLMRQESRFITHARSSAGASGLMQLMPATAKWVARKIGLRDYHPGRVNDTQTNLLLGTSYMRMVMENLDNHPLLASAAYNAGPGRARKWRGSAPLEGAIYAETIPFNETRDYVKKVMSNTIYYAAQFRGKSDSLKARLGTVGISGSETTKDADLP